MVWLQFCETTVYIKNICMKWKKLNETQIHSLPAGGALSVSLVSAVNKAAYTLMNFNTPISRSRHFEIESEALVGRNPEVKVNNNDLDYQARAATAI